MKILKFGGTSVGNAQRIRNLAGIIPTNEPVIVVLSAMAGTTNTLIEIVEKIKMGKSAKAIMICKELKENYISTCNDLFESETYREICKEYIISKFNRVEEIIGGDFCQPNGNEIVATGELLSTYLFHQYLAEQNHKSVLIPALTFMKTDENGEPDFRFTNNRLNAMVGFYPNNQLFITQGFICRDERMEISNLGRGGSDYTAAIIGNATNAAEVQIWTDIDGIHNNDPRYVEGTSPIRDLSYDEAAELAYFGAKILHPATIHPCRVKNIPVILKNTLVPNDPGTVISDFYNPQGFKALAAKDGITAIKIRSSRMLMAYGFLRKVFEIFEEFKTPVDMITTSEVAVSLTIDNTSNLDKIVDSLRQFSTVDVDTNQAIICIVGDMVADKSGTVHRVLSEIKHIPVRMISYGGSRNNISILVSAVHKVEALQSLHRLVENNSLVEVWHDITK